MWTLGLKLVGISNVVPNKAQLCTNIVLLGGKIAHQEVAPCPICLIPQNRVYSKSKKMYANRMLNSKGSHTGKYLYN